MMQHFLPKSLPSLLQSQFQSKVAMHYNRFSNTSSSPTSRIPRPPPLKLTRNAVEKLRLLQSGPEPKMVRVSVRSKGCSGLVYHLDYVQAKQPTDEILVQDGVTLLIDVKALFSIIGSEMDYQQDRLSEQFVFNNPNAKDLCGCGKSFFV